MATKTICQAVMRIDALAKVKGQCEYVGDVEFTGLAYAKLLRSPIPHGRLVRIDPSRAERLDGVFAVLTKQDFISGKINPYFGVLFRDQPIVSIDKVRYVGDIVAAVAAVSEERAQQALELIEVEYEELPAVLDPRSAMKPGAPLVHETTESSQTFYPTGEPKYVSPGEGNVLALSKVRRGDVEKGFQESDLILEHTFGSPAVHHFAMESHAVISRVTSEGVIEVWSTTQDPSVVRFGLAEIFNVPVSRVRVMTLYLGGGFGAKLFLKLEPLTVALALKASRPVKLVLTRDEVFATVTKDASEVRIKSGVTKDGRLVARGGEVIFDSGPYSELIARRIRMAAICMCGPYKIPNVSVNGFAVYTNNPPAGSFRGWGINQACWACERHMDLLADALGLDPLEFRLRNALDEGDSFVTGETVRSMGVKEELRAVAEKLDWKEGLRKRSNGAIARGKGLAAYIKMTVTPSLSMATLRMDEDGSVTILSNTVEMGQGSRTVLAQIVAEILDIPLTRICINHPDTMSAPYDTGTKSSRSAAHMGRAVMDAAIEIRKRLIEAASKLLEIPTEALEVAEGAVCWTVKPEVRMSFQEIIRQHFGTGTGMIGAITAQGIRNTKGKGGALDPETSQGVGSVYWFTGVAGCEVEVDRDTGVVRLLKFVASPNVGRVLNPVLLKGQIWGGALMGIGEALYEELIVENGQIVNGNMSLYRVPRMGDFPKEFLLPLIEIPYPEGPFGAMGAGEPPILPVAPAIGNAIARATGGQLFRLPMSPESVWRVSADEEGTREEGKSVKKSPAGDKQKN